MKAECPMGHSENLSWEEVYQRLDNDDFSCRENGCKKKVTYGIDHRFWSKYNCNVNGRDSPSF